MTTAQTVCLLCFVLLLGLAHANNKTSPSTENNGKENQISPTTIGKTNETTPKTPIMGTTNENPEQGSGLSTSDCVCPQTPNCPTTPKSIPTPTKNPTLDHALHYIISLPKETAILVLVVLVVACITLLLITLLCTCHVCHLRTVISRLQPYHSVDLYSVKKRSESPCKDDGKEKDQPTETCLMLAEVTVQEEEKKEEKEEEKEEKKKEESVPIYTEPPAEKPNGDVTQEENAYDIVSDEPAVGTTEVSDTGV